MSFSLDTGLGKFTQGKTCIYIKKLADIDEAVFKKLMQETIDYRVVNTRGLNS